MTDTIDVLRRVLDAGTAAEAVGLVPESWPFALIGPDAHGFHCSIIPPDAPPASARLEERGLTPGSGVTRIAAIRSAAQWLLDRMPVVPETAVDAEDPPSITDDDERTGGYVYDPPYLYMRLRMLLTGTASPTDEQEAAGLRNLLDHLEAHPLPEVADPAGSVPGAT